MVIQETKKPAGHIGKKVPSIILKSNSSHFDFPLKSKNQRFLNKLARCRLEINQAILSIFADFSMTKFLEFPISLRILNLKWSTDYEFSSLRSLKLFQTI